MTVHIHTKIETRPVESLIPYARNARTHSEQQVHKIASSMREFGFTNPVLIDETGEIIAGHGRVMAAKHLALPEVPCLILTGLTAAQRQAYVLADNKLAELSGWDEELLAQELKTLQSMDFDLELIGFDINGIENSILEENGQQPEQKKDGQINSIEYQEKYAVLVECNNEPHQAEIYDKLITMGLTCKILVN
jgi:ParB-like chromosome segregation protein Spo0J